MRLPVRPRSAAELAAEAALREREIARNGDGRLRAPDQRGTDDDAPARGTPSAPIPGSGATHGRGRGPGRSSHVGNS
jgi:hypothetical protein